EVDVAHSPGIQAAPGRLELFDDLHRANLRCARDRARGKARHERVEPVAIVGELALNDRGQVHDMREPLETHELRDAYGSVFADAPDIVAPEIDEHDMLRPLLLVALELLGEAHVFLVVPPAGPGPRDRMGLDARSFDAN